MDEACTRSCSSRRRSICRCTRRPCFSVCKRRDFTGAASLFAIELHTQSEAVVRAMVEHMQLFAIGASWGGYESLIFPAYPGPERSVRPWTGGQLVRPCL